MKSPWALLRLDSDDDIMVRAGCNPNCILARYTNHEGLEWRHMTTSERISFDTTEDVERANAVMRHTEQVMIISDDDLDRLGNFGVQTTIVDWLRRCHEYQNGANR